MRWTALIGLAWLALAGTAVAAAGPADAAATTLGRRLLTCVDTFAACPGWVGQCAVPGVATYCPCMCGSGGSGGGGSTPPTTTPPPSPPPATPPPSTGCVDTYAACPGWAGQCAVPGVATYCPCMCGTGSGGGSSPSPPVASPSPPVVTPPVSPPPGTVIVNPRLPSGPLMVGYFQSWSARWAGAGSDHELAKIPGYVNVVIVSFAKPDCTYSKGSLSLQGTGLDFSSDGRVVRDAIRALKAAQPNTRVLLAVGGATYFNFAGLNTRCIRDMVDDFGFDGADLDYEPQANCQASGGVVRCPTDAESVSVTAAMRSALPAGQYILSTASWHVGMYGEGSFAGSRPVSAYTGVNLAMAKSPAGQALDLINIMTYDAGNLASTGFDYKESYRAHRAVWKTQAIAIGVEVPPEAWGGNVISLAEVNERAGYARRLAGSAQYGVMLWSLQKTGCPSAQQITSAVCSVYALAGCSNALPFASQAC